MFSNLIIGCFASSTIGESSGSICASKYALHCLRCLSVSSAPVFIFKPLRDSSLLSLAYTASAVR